MFKHRSSTSGPDPDREARESAGGTGVGLLGTKAARAGVGVAVVFGAIVALEAPSFADHKDVTCTTSGYTGMSRLGYVSLDATRWVTSGMGYQFGPGTSPPTTHNNQNLHLNSSTYDSDDNLVKDGVYHNDPKDISNHAFAKGSSYFYFQQIFDVPNVTDPSCFTNNGYL